MDCDNSTLCTCTEVRPAFRNWFQGSIIWCIVRATGAGTEWKMGGSTAEECWRPPRKRFPPRLHPHTCLQHIHVNMCHVTTPIAWRCSHLNRPHQTQFSPCNIHTQSHTCLEWVDVGDHRVRSSHPQQSLQYHSHKLPHHPHLPEAGKCWQPRGAVRPWRASPERWLQCSAPAPARGGGGGERRQQLLEDIESKGRCLHHLYVRVVRAQPSSSHHTYTYGTGTGIGGTGIPHSAQVLPSARQLTGLPLMFLC